MDSYIGLVWFALLLLLQAEDLLAAAQATLRVTRRFPGSERPI